MAYVLAEPALLASAPAELWAQFKPRIVQARKVLDQSTLGDWKNRIIYTAGCFPPRSLPPKTATSDVLYQAILQLYTVNVVYQRSDGTEKSLLLHPYGVLHAGNRRYLIATDTPKNTSSIRLFALQRFVKAQITYEAARINPKFDINSFVQEGLSGWRIQQTRIVVNMQAQGLAIQQLQDSELDKLKITPLNNRISEIQFCTALTYELIRWCIAMGNHIYVQGPPELILAIKDTLGDPLKPLV